MCTNNALFGIIAKIRYLTIKLEPPRFCINLNSTRRTSIWISKTAATNKMNVVNILSCLKLEIMPKNAYSHVSSKQYTIRMVLNFTAHIHTQTHKIQLHLLDIF